jgi:hypothetical protein
MLLLGFTRATWNPLPAQPHSPTTCLHLHTATTAELSLYTQFTSPIAPIPKEEPQNEKRPQFSSQSLSLPLFREI